ncbi:MAG: hypothetical protein PHT19_04495 [Methylococcus sp.]|nr:hypothetical protein [Methylococcus sp.]
MPVLDLPPPIEERVLCSIAAAEKYGLPAHLVLAVAEQEGGKPGLWVRNANGTYDVGAMQFNTAYLAGLARYGITAAAVAQPGCYAYDLASWRLSGHLYHDQGGLWTRVANYHSRNPRHNAAYRAAIQDKSGRWAAWLEARTASQAVSETVAQPSWSGTEPAAVTPSQVPAAAYVPRAILAGKRP